MGGERSLPAAAEGRAGAGEQDLLGALLAVGRRRAGHPALLHFANLFDRQPWTVTFQELGAAAGRAAAAFRAAGVEREDGVAIVAPSLPETLVAFAGASRAGVAFPLNPLLSAEAIAAQLRLGRARVCVVHGWPGPGGTRERVLAALADAPRVRLMVDVEAGSAAARSRLPHQDWNDFLRSAPAAAPPGGDPATTAALFHTGGTGGAPKLAQLGARALLAGPSLAAAGLGWRPDDRVLDLLPFFHVGGLLTIALSALLTGATVATCGLLGAREPDLPARFWALLDEQAITVAGLVPTTWGRVVETAPPSPPATLRALLTGGASIPAGLVALLRSRVGVPLAQVFGMTEFAGFCCGQPMDGQWRAPGVGFAPPPMELRVQGPGEGSGEVLVRGPNAFSGYRTEAGVADDPAAGWVATGDLGTFAGDGQLVLTGRSKDVIIRSGHNIDPGAIEEVACRHPGVLAAAAVGSPDAYAGEVPVLYVAARPGTLDLDALMRFVADRIEEPPLRPREIRLVDEIPLTPVGKVARYRLRQRAVLERARSLLAGHPECELSCEPAQVRQVRVRWLAPVDPEAERRAAAALASVGLEYKAFDA